MNASGKISSANMVEVYVRLTVMDKTFRNSTNHTQISYKHLSILSLQNQNQNRYLFNNSISGDEFVYADSQKIEIKKAISLRDDPTESIS